MGNKKTIYFAFGSNLDLDRMQHRCPGAVCLGTASLKNYRLAFGGKSSSWNGGGVATIIPAWQEEVQGVLYEITGKDLKALDRCEGHPAFYIRTPVDVLTEKEEILEVETYILDIDVQAPPQQAYYALIWNAYRKYGFNTQPLVEAGKNACDPNHRSKHKVLVYGTLMQGFGNHRILEGSSFLGKYKTKKGYTMYDLGWYPGIVKGGDSAIHGELYEVDDETLAEMDRLESHPNFYERRLVKLENDDVVFCYIIHEHFVKNKEVIANGKFKNKY